MLKTITGERQKVWSHQEEGRGLFLETKHRLGKVVDPYVTELNPKKVYSFALLL